MNYISPSNHPDSPLSATTVESMIGRAKDLGLKYIAITDMGYLSSVLKAYMYGEKKGIKIIPGVEILFKDTECDIIKNTESERIKYFKFIIHATDQEAYQLLVKKCSDFTKKTITIEEDKYPLLNWKDLEEIAHLNVTATNSDVNCLITKHLLVNRPDLSLKTYQKIKSIFGDKFYPSIIPNSFDRYWNAVVRVSYLDKYIDIPAYDRVEIEGESRAFAKKIIDNLQYGKPVKLTHVYINKIKYSVSSKYREISKAKLLNEFQSVPSGDIQLKSNMLIYGLAFKFGDLDRLLINSHSYYPESTDKVVQDMRLGEKKRVYQTQHMQSTEDSLPYLKALGLSEDDIMRVVENSYKWASNFDNFKLKYDYRLPNVGTDSTTQMMSIIEKNGRMKWDDVRYTTQFKEEYELLTKNGVIDLIPYFLPLVDIFQFYKENGYLTGPARGSAGGFLLSYLMGVTHIDPIKYGLSSSRFLTIDRIQQGNLPDIDSDFESREPLVGKDGHSGFLYEKYGDKAAQVSTRTLLRIKSAILDANRFINHGDLEPYIQKLSKSLPNTPQGISDSDFIFGYTDGDGNHIDGLFESNSDLQKYAEKRPNEWDMVQKALSISRQNSRHACAYIIADRPIEDIVPVFEVGGVKRVTQPEHKQCEFAGLIKYDFLVVSAVKDIRICLDYINSRNKEKLEPGYFNRDGQNLYIWDLPEDQDVYAMLGRGETETIFQLNTVSVTPFVRQIKPTSIIDCATITSLVRPGPLDFTDEKTGRNMVEEYVERKYGRSSSDIPILESLLPETYGVLVYQEQVTKIARELGKMNIIDSENVRIAMGKKKLKEMEKLKPNFIKGASETVGPEVADKVWSMMATFARYGFNKSHAVAYSAISYACAYLKYHYPLEWWASVISNADTKEINEVFYRYVKDMILPPDINISTEAIAIDYTNNKIRNKLSSISGLGTKIADRIMENRPYSSIDDFASKGVCGPEMTRKLILIGAMDSLFSDKTTKQGKYKAYEDALAKVEYNKKVNEKRNNIATEKDAKKLKRLQTTLDNLLKIGQKPGIVPTTYAMAEPITEYLMKKSVFPSINLDLHKIICNRKNKLTIFNAAPFPRLSTDMGKKEYTLVPGEVIQTLDSKRPSKPETELASVGYIVKTREFSYKGNTKKALSLTIDLSGYVSEKVIWPDRITGELTYPKDLKEGAIAFFIFSKREDSDYTNIKEVYVEQEPI